MFFINDITNFEKSKVKLHYRKGKVIKQHVRKNNNKTLLSGIAIGAGSVAAIGGAYLLGQKSGLNKNKVFMDDLANSIKDLKNKPTNINIEVPNVNTVAKEKVLQIPINEEAIVKPFVEVAEHKFAQHTINIPQVPLPKKISPFTDNTKKAILEMNDEALEKMMLKNVEERKLLDDTKNMYLDVQGLEKGNLLLKKAISNKNKREVKNLTRDINIQRKSLNLPVLDINNIDDFTYKQDKSYFDKLSKYLDRQYDVYNFCLEEVKKRKQVNYVEDVNDFLNRQNKMNELMDDFCYLGDIIKFIKK